MGRSISGKVSFYLNVVSTSKVITVDVDLGSTSMVTVDVDPKSTFTVTGHVAPRSTSTVIL